MQIFSVDATIFKEQHEKKTLSKVGHNQPKIYFSVLPTGPKPAQISDIFHRNLPPCYFSIMTLLICTCQMESCIDLQLVTSLAHNYLPAHSCI